ncbi:hypothetical protein CMK22_15855 [Candidatus Poribacteria bacterium]|nr:hypothetical protein [Candidatus Poribacteria bacterium]
MNQQHSVIVKEIITELESRDSFPPLSPTKEWSSTLTTRLENYSLGELFDGFAVTDSEFGNCVRSGLLLWNDALDSSHEIVQNIGTKTGNYWHAIMHRRESDYSNAKYWFGRVGKHPIYFQLLCYAQELSQTEQLEEYTKILESNDEWNPAQFVDWCQAATNSEDNKKTFLEQIQLKELQLLIDFSCKNALI